MSTAPTHMKFGVILPNYGPNCTRLALIDSAIAAETLAFDSIWTTDHLALPEDEAANYTPIFEAITSLAYLAASTGRIKLGISALVLPQRDPLEVAKAIASLDVLSGGRTLLAVGIGWSQREYAHLGHEFKTRGARMDEAIQVLRTAWRGSRVISYQGKHYAFEKAVFAPGPVQAGGPPLWVAGNSPRALRRAVMLSDGWHPVGLPPAELESQLQSVRPLLANRPFSVAPRLTLSFEPNPAQPTTLSGSPPEVAAQLEAYRQAGATYAVIDFRGESQAARERAMRRFAAEVVPQFTA